MCKCVGLILRFGPHPTPSTLPAISCPPSCVLGSLGQHQYRRLLRHSSSGLADQAKAPPAGLRFKNWRRPDHKNPYSRGRTSWQRRRISNHGWKRTLSGNPFHRDEHPVEFASARLRLQKMMPLSRCRIPKIVRHAAFDHMNDYDLETQSCGVGSDQVRVHEVTCRLAHDFASRDIRWPWLVLLRGAHAEMATS
jgi:hypothetical protein